MKFRSLGFMSGIVSNRKVLALVASITVAGALVAAAANATGAFFSDTQAGTITGSIGTVKVEGGGDLSFSNLLPGAPQTVTVKYKNTGTDPEDIWLTFPNVPALHALNNLGSYGEVTVTDSSTGQVFQSTNLNDNRPNASGTCGAFNPAGCWPLPTQLEVRAGLAKGDSGTVQFTFQYASKLGNSAQGGTFNEYPAAGSAGADAAGPTGSGLPYNLVATQVGITPGS